MILFPAVEEEKDRWKERHEAKMEGVEEGERVNAKGCCLRFLEKTCLQSQLKRQRRSSPLPPSQVETLRSANLFSTQLMCGSCHRHT